MDEFKYWYPVKTIKQMGLDGKDFDIPVIGLGHIQYCDVILCGLSRTRSKNQKIVKHAIENKKICPTCQELWKAHPSSAWYRFVNGTKIQSTPLPALVKS